MLKPSNSAHPHPQTAKFRKRNDPMNDPAQTPTECDAKTRAGVPCAKFPMESKRRCKLDRGLNTRPRSAAGKATISAANTKHARYKNCREKRAKEKCYLGEVKRVMAQAELAGLLTNK